MNQNTARLHPYILVLNSMNFKTMDNNYLFTYVSRFPVNQLIGQCTAALYRYSVHFQALAMYIHNSKGKGNTRDWEE